MNLKKLARKFDEEGYIIIPSYFARSKIEKLNTESARCYHSHLRRLNTGGLHRSPTGTAISPSQKEGFLNMIPEPRMPFWDPAIFCEGILIELLGLILNSKSFVLPFYTININVPGTSMQFPHRDFGVSFKEFSIPLPTHALVVNIPLTDFTQENGSTEIWPGTHRIHDDFMSFGENLTKRSAGMASLRANMPAGSVLIRDLRLWHRGTPNQSKDIRTMLSLVYTHDFLRHPLPNKLNQKLMDSFPKNARNLLRFIPIAGGKKDAEYSFGRFRKIPAWPIG